MQDLIALVSVGDIAKASGRPPGAVRAWLAFTQRAPVAVYNGDPLYIAAVVHALLDEVPSDSSRRTAL